MMPREPKHPRVRCVREYRREHMVKGWQGPASKRYASRVAAHRSLERLIRWHGANLIYARIEVRTIYVAENWRVLKEHKGGES